MPELRVIPRRELRRGATVYENIAVLSYSVGSPHQDSSYGEVNRQFSLENQCLRPMIFGPLAQTRIRKISKALLKQHMICLQTCILSSKHRSDEGCQSVRPSLSLDRRCTVSLFTECKSPPKSKSANLLLCCPAAGWIAADSAKATAVSSGYFRTHQWKAAAVGRSICLRTCAVSCKSARNT